MLNLQEEKIKLEIKQTEIALRDIEHNRKIADKSIEAQVADRKDEREVNKTMHFHRLVFAACIVLLVIIFAIVALVLDKDALVLDIIKVVLGFVGGWGASITWRAKQHAADTPK